MARIAGAAFLDARNLAPCEGAPRQWRKSLLRLLLGHAEREFAIADAHRKAFRKARCRFFAIGGDEFGELGKQSGLRQTVAVDTIDAGFDPGLVQIAEGSSFLLVVRSVFRRLNCLRFHVQVDLPWRFRHCDMTAR